MKKCSKIFKIATVAILVFYFFTMCINAQEENLKKVQNYISTTSSDGTQIELKNKSSQSIDILLISTYDDNQIEIKEEKLEGGQSKFVLLEEEFPNSKMIKTIDIVSQKKFDLDKIKVFMIYLDICITIIYIFGLFLYFIQKGKC